MASDRTTVTELATGLGMTGYGTVEQALRSRPAEFVNVPEDVWERLGRLLSSREHVIEFETAFENGRAFLAHPDALRGRRPIRIEWKGAHRAPGDEVLPVDLRIDHVYLVSCKYQSRNIQNASPRRLFDRLLTAGHSRDPDWYAETAPGEYQYLYRTCIEATGLDGMPSRATGLSAASRGRLRDAMSRQGRGYPTEEARAAYRSLCEAVSKASARSWQHRLTDRRVQETMLWRLLRVGSAPYFVLGSEARNHLRLRVATPWDWRQDFRLVRMTAEAASAGQPRVDWAAEYVVRADGGRRSVKGHAEVRWSHGRFAQPPEAKIYLDTPHDDVPGYYPLG